MHVSAVNGELSLLLRFCPRGLGHQIWASRRPRPLADATDGPGSEAQQTGHRLVLMVGTVGFRAGWGRMGEGYLTEAEMLVGRSTRWC